MFVLFSRVMHKGFGKNVWKLKNVVIIWFSMKDWRYFSLNIGWKDGYKMQLCNILASDSTKLALHNSSTIHKARKYLKFYVMKHRSGHENVAYKIVVTAAYTHIRKMSFKIFLESMSSVSRLTQAQMKEGE